MRRPILIVLLSLSTVGGFASGFWHLRHGHTWRAERRATFERHVVDLCTEAALKAQAGQPPTTGN